MCDWFSQLSVQCHEETELKKLRVDWLTYMALLESTNTARFLSLESSDNSKPKVSQ